MQEKRIHYKGRGKTERPTCPHCGEDMKVSLEYVKGGAPRRFGVHCTACEYEVFDKQIK